jgi:hypothetical protein
MNGFWPGTGMKRWQQWLSCYLVLCLVVASVVGLSPTLHWWIEHGGRGHAHAHAGLQKSRSLEREHAHPHRHDFSHAASRAQLPRLLVEKYPRPRLFGLEVKDVYRAVGGVLALLARHLPKAPPGDDDREPHTHHSLAQMLLSGAVEGTVDVSLVKGPAGFTRASLVSTTHFLTFDFNPQTASRAPPIRSQPSTIPIR